MANDKSDKGFTVVDRRIDADGEDSKTAKVPESGSSPAPGENNKVTDSSGTSGPKTAPEKEKKEETKAKAAPKTEGSNKERPPLPPVTFPTFLLSLHSSALIHLGEIPNPLTNKSEVDLEIARQNIDLLEVIKDKTAGNLDDDEQRLIDNILYELRVLYVKICEAVKGNCGK